MIAEGMDLLQEKLHRKRMPVSNAEMHVSMAKSCLDVLVRRCNIQDSGTDSIERLQPRSGRTFRNAFETYAILHWSSHLQAAEKYGLPPETMIMLLTGYTLTQWFRVISDISFGENEGKYLTPLHFLCDLDLRKTLLAALPRKGDPATLLTAEQVRRWLNRENHHGDTPLDLAVEAGSVDIADRLYQRGRAFDLEWSLFVAARSGHVDMTRHLVRKHGANVDIQDDRRQTPRSRAASAGHVEAVKLMLPESKLGAHSYDAFYQTDDGHLVRSWTTPLRRAVCNGNLNMVDALLKSEHIDPECCDRDGNTILHGPIGGGAKVMRALIDSGKFELSETNKRGMSPLAAAAYAGNPTAVRELLKTPGVDLGKLSINSQSVLAISMLGQNPNVEVVKSLIETEYHFDGLDDRPTTFDGPRRRPRDSALSIARMKKDLYDKIFTLVEAYTKEQDQRNEIGPGRHADPRWSANPRKCTGFISSLIWTQPKEPENRKMSSETSCSKMVWQVRCPRYALSCPGCNAGSQHRRGLPLRPQLAIGG